MRDYSEFDEVTLHPDGGLCGAFSGLDAPYCSAAKHRSGGSERAPKKVDKVYRVHSLHREALALALESPLPPVKRFHARKGTERERRWQKRARVECERVISHIP